MKSEKNTPKPNLCMPKGLPASLAGDNGLRHLRQLARKNPVKGYVDLAKNLNWDEFGIGRQERRKLLKEARSELPDLFLTLCLEGRGPEGVALFARYGLRDIEALLAEEILEKNPEAMLSNPGFEALYKALSFIHELTLPLNHPEPWESHDFEVNEEIIVKAATRLAFELLLDARTLGNDDLCQLTWALARLLDSRIPVDYLRIAIPELSPEFAKLEWESQPELLDEEFYDTYLNTAPYRVPRAIKALNHLLLKSGFGVENLESRDLKFIADVLASESKTLEGEIQVLTSRRGKEIAQKFIELHDKVEFVREHLVKALGKRYDLPFERATEGLSRCIEFCETLPEKAEDIEGYGIRLATQLAPLYDAEGDYRKGVDEHRKQLLDDDITPEKLIEQAGAVKSLQERLQSIVDEALPPFSEATEHLLKEALTEIKRIAGATAKKEQSSTTADEASTEALEKTLQAITVERDQLKKELAAANARQAQADSKLKHLREQLSAKREASLPEPKASQNLPYPPEALRELGRDAGTVYAALKTMALLYSEDEALILDSAWSSAQAMASFRKPGRVFELLDTLCGEYRDHLMQGIPDSEARALFGKAYRANESETVMNNEECRRQRTFRVDGEDLLMPKHLALGASPDISKTLRIHFHWDSERSRMIIGHVGPHLYIPGRK